MLKSKSQLTCSYCSKKFRDPILFPCEDSICSEHLSDRDVVKQNRIKGKKCKQEFGVKDSGFQSKEPLTQLLENPSYLSGEELSLKHELEESLRIFFEYYDEFSQNRTKLDMDV